MTHKPKLLKPEEVIYLLKRHIKNLELMPQTLRIKYLRELAEVQLREIRES